MPELPDIEAYCAALRPRIIGSTLKRVRLASPFLLRSVTPPLISAHGRSVLSVRGLGCQTGGRVLADRALSRLLKDDWPRSLEDLEERFPAESP